MGNVGIDHEAVPQGGFRRDQFTFLKIDGPEDTEGHRVPVSQFNGLDEVLLRLRGLVVAEEQVGQVLVGPEEVREAGIRSRRTQ